MLAKWVIERIARRFDKEEDLKRLCERKASVPFRTVSNFAVKVMMQKQGYEVLTFWGLKGYEKSILIQLFVNYIAKKEEIPCKDVYNQVRKELLRLSPLAEEEGIKIKRYVTESRERRGRSSNNKEVSTQ